MVSILSSVRKGVAHAKRRAPPGVFVACSGNPKAQVSVSKQGCALALNNWVVNISTGEAKCVVFVSVRGQSIKKSSLRGGTIAEVIHAAVVGLAMGAYDDVPK